MQQKSKDALVIWVGTMLGGAGGWMGAVRLATTYAVPTGVWGVVGGVIGAVTGAAMTKMIVDDPGALPSLEVE